MKKNLPTYIRVNGKKYKIRTNYKQIIAILETYGNSYSNDKDTDLKWKAKTCLYGLYEAVESIPGSDLNEAYEKAIRFIDCGNKFSSIEKASAVDWKLLKRMANNVPDTENMHWWTFVGLYERVEKRLIALSRN